MKKYYRKKYYISTPLGRVFFDNKKNAEKGLAIYKTLKGVSFINERYKIYKITR